MSLAPILVLALRTVTLDKSPSIDAIDLVETRRDRAFVTRVVKLKEVKEKDFATVAWCLVWQYRMYRAQMGKGVDSTQVRWVADRLVRFSSSTNAETYLAMYTFDATFWGWSVIPGSSEYPMKREERTVRQPDGSSKQVKVWYQPVDKPSDRMLKRRDGWLRRARELAPQDPVVLLSVSGIKLSDGDKEGARLALKQAYARGVTDVLPLPALVMDYDLNPSPQSKAALTEYLAETGDSILTKLVLKGRPDLVKLLRR